MTVFQTPTQSYHKHQLPKHISDIKQKKKNQRKLTSSSNRLTNEQPNTNSPQATASQTDRLINKPTQAHHGHQLLKQIEFLKQFNQTHCTYQLLTQIDSNDNATPTQTHHGHQLLKQIGSHDIRCAIVWHGLVQRYQAVALNTRQGVEVWHKLDVDDLIVLLRLRKALRDGAVQRLWRGVERKMNK